MIVVLKTQGKNADVDVVSIHLFKNLEEADEFCRNNTDEREQKYWSFAQRVPQNVELELGRYENYIRPNELLTWKDLKERPESGEYLKLE